MLKLGKKTDILNELKKNQNVVLISSSRDHEKTMSELHKAVSKKFKKICMITVNKSFSTLIKKFQEEKIDYSNYCFIDCISKKNMIVQQSKQCIYVSSPTALTELALTIGKLRQIDLIILDNISSFLLYNEDAELLKFLHGMMTKIRQTKTKAVYSILKESKKEFVADLTLFADAVMES